MLTRLVLTLVLSCLSGCLSLSFSGGSYDKRAVSIVSLDLFNQRAPEEILKNPWRGDWLFRRERLLVIDKYLRDRKPDVIMLQGAMSRIGSATENDLKIIGQGGLDGYDFDRVAVARYRDTGELESHAIAVGLPLQLVTLPSNYQRNWEFEGGGRLTLFLIEIEESEVAIFGLSSPSDASKTDFYLEKVRLVMEETIAKYRLCPLRMAIYGYLKLPADKSNYSRFLSRFRLKDISDGFCEIVSDCYTGSPVNEIYMTTSGGAPSQLDYILVPRASFVGSSLGIFKEPDIGNLFGRAYGQEKFWATERFGWSTQVRFSKCEPSDFTLEP